jgi:hypothetical protein
MSNWLKKYIRPVGLAMIASFVSFVLWLVPPTSTAPAWLFALSASLLAISTEVAFNSIVDRNEAMSLEHRILAIRNGNKNDPILIIKPGTNVEVGNLLSVYRNVDGVVSFVALCVVDHKQDDGKTQLKLILCDFTESETSKVNANDTTVISSWKVYSRVDHSVINRLKGA